MIDQVFIHISSGKGGNGAISGRREKFVARGGPDGGDGGNGGSVYMLADQNVNTLQAFRYRRSFAAGNGGNGAGANRHGRNGDDIVISVPAGTQVWITDEPPRLLADLSEHGQRVLLASGGSGGRGNARFKSSTNQFPKLAEAGEDGEELDLRLELKLLADVGIIGVPNAGKSSLLSVVSAARPKVADYPFTTLEPVLGVVERHDKSFVMVDIPGLIEGAHKGVGLGHEFLRHVERTRVL
ncbi:MAG: GTPase ObgE, partial [Chloroflexi bacterium]|nr:GTPase ObgE [Chloroflexota bacterium]